MKKTIALIVVIVGAFLFSEFSGRAFGADEKTQQTSLSSLDDTLLDLFSGAQYQMIASGRYMNNLIKTDFNLDGSLTMEYSNVWQEFTLTTSKGKGSGKWGVANGKVCMDYRLTPNPDKTDYYGQLPNRIFRNPSYCWTIRKEKSGLAAYDEFGRKDWTIFFLFHPKYSSKQELYTAIGQNLGRVGFQVAQKTQQTSLSSLDDKLLDLFSGAKYELIALGTSRHVRESILKTEFNLDGSLAMKYSFGWYRKGEGSGKWEVRNGKLCMDYRLTPDLDKYDYYGTLPNRIFRNPSYCWKIKKGRVGFAAYDESGNRDWRVFFVSHPKYSSKQELYAAIPNLKGSPAGQSETSADIAGKRKAAEEALKVEIAKKKKAAEAEIAEMLAKAKAEAQSIASDQPDPLNSVSASGFFVSKLGHVVTNAHVIKGCSHVTIGDSANKQTLAIVLQTDTRNDLALLKVASMKMASIETKSLVRKLGVRIVPMASNGLLRSEDVKLGETVLTAGYPFGDFFSNTIKVTRGIVSSVRGVGDDSGQFQLDAAVQEGSSGGPIYDVKGNIVGVVVAQLDKLKMAEAIGSLPENVNFGIKASTVRQFLSSSGIPTKWSQKEKAMPTQQLAKIAQSQALMVTCHGAK